jgi:peptidoglycan/LPS O-acetylase OafA/YrhL
MPGLDGLRALAVAAVFAYHAGPQWLPGGFLGVDVFFVISGYLITSLLLAELAAEGRIRLVDFLARRARRLLPALFVMLAVSLVVATATGWGEPGLRGDALSALVYVANWRFVLAHQSYFDSFGRPPMLRHLWSLAVEEQFYLLWPPLLVLGMRLRRRFALPLLVSIAAIASSAAMWHAYGHGEAVSRAYYGTDTHGAPLLIGVLLAFVWRPGRMPSLRFPFARPALDLLSLGALAAVCYAFVVASDRGAGIYHGGLLAVSICAAVLVATAAHPLGTLGRILGTSLPRWVGERSYGIYLWHWPVLVLSRPGVDVHLPRLPVVALQVGSTLALAAASYRFVELPIRRGALSTLGRGARSRTVRRAAPAGIAVAVAGAVAGLAVAAPDGASPLPPGFTPAALAASARSAQHLVVLRRVHAGPPGRPRLRQTEVRRGALHVPNEPTWLPRGGPVLAVGDSVMLGAGSALSGALGRELSIDAVVSRQPTEIIDRLLAYRAERALPRRVIVQIGNNGPVYYADWQRLKNALAGVPLVVLVNVRVDQSWQSEVNQEMREAVTAWRHATIADWYHVSATQGTLVDGTHTSVLGGDLYAAVIERALERPHLGGVTR